MVIATGTLDGKEMLILGLSAENLRRLQAGEPILKRDQPGLPCDLAIIYGETEEAIAKAIMEACIG